MSTTATPLGLFKLLIAGQSGGEVKHNTNQQVLEPLITRRCLDRDLFTPPGSPAQGDCYIVDDSSPATGAWDNLENHVVVYVGTAWIDIVPVEGMAMWVADENITVVFDGTVWSPTGGGDMLLGTAQTVSGAKTFLNSTLKQRNPANTFSYTVVGAAITADRNLTLPLATAADTLAALGVVQTWSAAQTHLSSTLKLRNPADTFSYTIVSAAIGADRNLTLPLATGADTLAALGVVQTWSVAQTFLSSTLKLRNPADTFNYTIVPAAIAADRTLNLPLITGTDTLVVLGLAQTWTGTQTFGGIIRGGTNQGTFANYIDLSQSASLARIQMSYPGGGIYHFSEDSLLGTNDVFTGGQPVSTSGYVIVDAYASAGLVLQARNGTNIIVMNCGQGTEITRCTVNGFKNTGDFQCNDSAKGLVLKDTQGTPHYWRVSVSTLGVLTTADLGTTPPV